jgi:hypothetical protein
VKNLFHHFNSLYAGFDLLFTPGFPHFPPSFPQILRKPVDLQNVYRLFTKREKPHGRAKNARQMHNVCQPD